jgi:hypothetical protein
MERNLTVLIEIASIIILVIMAMGDYPFWRCDIRKRSNAKKTKDHYRFPEV